VSAKHIIAKQSFPVGLYGITDPDLIPQKQLISSVESALRGGCKIIQYRDKQATEIERLRHTQNLRAVCSDYDATFIINDDVNLATRCLADGVHLGKNDGCIHSALKVLGAEKYLGVTCHSDLDYAQHCIDQGVSYCAFGRMFPSHTKPSAPHCRLETLAHAANLDTPIVAIGGINIDNMSSILDTPVNNIAVIHSLFAHENIEQAAQELSSLFNRLNTTL
jgi:thiamine-phosphate pyrophosphorylase